MQSFGGRFLNKVAWGGTGLIEGSKRRKCVLVLFMKINHVKSIML